MGMKKGRKQYGRLYTDEIWRLHYGEGKTIRETAEILGTDYKSVNNAINREHRRQRKLDGG